jgi:uncharacterized membrane-anchored protein YjiN (DUF445 family)
MKHVINRSGMERNLKRKLDRLEEKIDKARRQNNILALSQYTLEKENILRSEQAQQEAIESKTTHTLHQIMQGYSEEDRRRLTTDMITAVCIGDILNSAVMDILDDASQFGINSIPMLKELQDITVRLNKVVGTINDVGIDVFNVQYRDAADKIESRVMATLKNYIFNEIKKMETV